jgi:DNA-directed RNA polymerase sigma subunit (sigma70/sigma32)
MDRQIRLLLTKLAAQRVGQLLKTKLTYRQRETIKLRSGVGDSTTYSRPECARILDTTVRNIERIETAAITKLKREDPLLWDLIVELGKIQERDAL